MLDLIVIGFGGAISLSSLVLGTYFIYKGMLVKQNQGKCMLTGATLMIVSKVLELMILK
ncbi:MAG: hypothetical protein J6D33_03485 [Turicibacter sp.]|nr:hypothetical protein [Turicibacter sp.]